MAVKLQNMKNSEITEQIKLFNWARSVREFIPELKLLHHIPNEGKRTNGALLKAAGMVSGVPDLSLPVARRGFNGLYIEMKFGNSKPTKAQVEFMTMLKDQGYKTAVTYSAEEARSLIRHYLARADNFDLVNCEEAPKIFGCCEGVEADWTPCANCELYKRNKHPYGQTMRILQAEDGRVDVLGEGFIQAIDPASMNTEYEWEIEGPFINRHFPKQVYWKSEATTLTAFLFDRDDMKEKRSSGLFAEHKDRRIRRSDHGA